MSILHVLFGLYVHKKAATADGMPCCIVISKLPNYVAETFSLSATAAFTVPAPHFASTCVQRKTTQARGCVFHNCAYEMFSFLCRRSRHTRLKFRNHTFRVISSPLLFHLTRGIEREKIKTGGKTHTHYRYTQLVLYDSTNK